MKYNSVKDPIRIYNEILGGKWRLLILYQLFSSTQRFKDLQQNIDGITPRMLTKELRLLEKFNIVEKEVYREVPPRVEYSLTDDGVRLFPLIENIKRFGETFAYLLNEGERPESEVEDIWMVNEEAVEFELPKTEIQAPLKEETTNVLLEKIEKPVYKSIVEKPEKVKKIKPQKVIVDDKKIVQLELF
jgi:DNA-binding HxlR family transcriptional regulator